ncbi:hypothetical protein DICA4_F02740 [Diutina catenulata]
MSIVEAKPSKLVSADEIIQLSALDFSKLSSETGKQELAKQVEDSLTTRGFVSVVNHGIDLDEFERIRRIAYEVCTVPREVQGEYLAGAWTSDAEDRTKSLGAENGSGYKPQGYWSMEKGVQDAIVFYNFNNLLQDALYQNHVNYPEPARKNLELIREYYNKVHTQVLRNLCGLCDIALELPEGTLYDRYFKIVQGDLHESGSGVARFMLYNKMDPKDEEKTQKKWLRGHSDSGGFTLITSQPILSIQIRDYFTGQWKYVGHTPGGLIVNVGDALEFLTGGYFKSAIHRVIAPPEDQRDYTRFVVIYFSQFKKSAVLDPESLQSPKLQKLDVSSPPEWKKITSGQWQNEKGRLFGQSKVNDSPGDEPNLVLVYGRLHERWHQAETNFTLEEARKRHRIIELAI